MRIVCSSPKDEDCEHKRPQPVPGWGLSAFPRLCLSYVKDAEEGIIKDAPGWNLPDRERRMDRRTACLHQADAFREKALADPDHHDEWIDEAIEWLERAMEASRRAVATVEPADADATSRPVTERPALG